MLHGGRDGFTSTVDDGYALLGQIRSSNIQRIQTRPADPNRKISVSRQGGQNRTYDVRWTTT